MKSSILNALDVKPTKNIPHDDPTIVDVFTSTEGLGGNPEDPTKGGKMGELAAKEQESNLKLCVTKNDDGSTTVTMWVLGWWLSNAEYKQLLTAVSTLRDTDIVNVYATCEFEHYFDWVKTCPAKVTVYIPSICGIKTLVALLYVDQMYCGRNAYIIVSGDWSGGYGTKSDSEDRQEILDYRLYLNYAKLVHAGIMTEADVKVLDIENGIFTLTGEEYERRMREVVAKGEFSNKNPKNLDMGAIHRLRKSLTELKVYN